MHSPQRRVLGGGHTSKCRADVFDTLVLIKGDEAVRAEFEHFTELAGVVLQFQLRRFSQTQCLLHLSKLSGQSQCEGDNQRGQHKRLSQEVAARPVVVCQDLCHVFPDKDRQRELGNFAVGVDAFHFVDHRRIDEVAFSGIMGQGGKYRRCRGIGAILGNVSHDARTRNAVHSVQCRHGICSELQVTVKAGEVPGIYRDHYHPAEITISEVDATCQLNRPLSRGTSHHRLGDEHGAGVGRHVHLEVLSV